MSTIVCYNKTKGKKTKKGEYSTGLQRNLCRIPICIDRKGLKIPKRRRRGNLRHNTKTECSQPGGEGEKKNHTDKKER